MKVGIIGLGRMGLAIAKRLLKKNHTVFGFDLQEISKKNLQNLGGTPVEDVTKIPHECNVIWLMLPAGDVIDKVISQIKPHTKSGTIIVDGGNSLFTNTIRRAKDLEKNKISFLDCGTSGGLRGEEIGFSLMIGGEKNSYEKLTPIFDAIATPNGYAYMGESGAGHYVKMVHNGIEYVVLQAFADGFNLLKNGHYKNLELKNISGVWQNGSIIRSFIVELLNEIFSEITDFASVPGKIGENLTGQWALEEANKHKIDFGLLKNALNKREWSRQTGGDFSTKLVALLRKKFGGHMLQ
jgi:6-phosphogluconate dehydrogenase